MLQDLSYDRSDSFMDDCNPTSRCCKICLMTVQIPLWTIVTNSGALPKTGYDSSDSSMDDCNVVNLNNHRRNFKVQIPLWTIVTLKPAAQKPATPGFRFLYGRL